MGAGGEAEMDAATERRYLRIGRQVGERNAAALAAGSHPVPGDARTGAGYRFGWSAPALRARLVAEAWATAPRASCTA